MTADGISIYCTTFTAPVSLIARRNTSVQINVEKLKKKLNGEQMTFSRLLMMVHVGVLKFDYTGLMLVDP